nr:MAG TPA: hypothetical protein [Caudoviricetes sp.]
MIFSDSKEDTLRHRGQSKRIDAKNLRVVRYILWQLGSKDLSQRN